jgi:hypothetical protein
MAIFGVGAHYDEDVSEQFISRGVACVGWSEDDAPPAHAILRLLRAGDIVFLKSFTPHVGLIVKAVGVVLVGRVEPIEHLGQGVSVRWVWTGEERIGKLDDKWPVRSVAIYEEHHPAVQARVIDLLLGERGG